MRTFHCILTAMMAIGLAAPLVLSAQTTSSPPVDQLSVFVIRLARADGAQLAPALQRLVVAGLPDRPTSSVAVDTLPVLGTVVLLDSAFRASVAAERASLAVRQPPSPLTQFVRVVPDQATNSLLVRASQHDLALIREVIRRVDR
jgi:type II secretory pathway component GspD/PulD (secretin)